jgi:hypothetical protein
LPACGAYSSALAATVALAILWVAFFAGLMAIVVYVFRFIPLVGRMGRPKDKPLN